LFVEEVMRTLRESGAIQVRQDEGGALTWDISGEAAAVEVPTTLNSLIMSRLDRLETTNRRLMQVASIIGINFRPPVLGRVYPYGDLNGTLPARLVELVQLDLTLFAPPDAYVFRHGLTREVAYESLAYALRRDLHVRVGEDIEQRHQAELAEYYGVLARWRSPGVEKSIQSKTNKRSWRRWRRTAMCTCW
jgi:predicted ATPase